MTLCLLRISDAMRQGVSAVCSTCTLYWRGREQGIPGHQCLATDDCGSPLRGGNFHEYVGPITDLSRWCFVCGCEATHGVKTESNSVGICKNHVRLLTELRPKDWVDDIHHQISNGKQVIPAESLLKRSLKKTLAQVLYEVDTYYTSKMTHG